MSVDISLFNQLVENNGGVIFDFNTGHSSVIKNVDLFSNPDGSITDKPVAVTPVTKASSIQDDQFTPEWKKSVDSRLGNLERNVEILRKDTTEIKGEISEMKGEISEMKGDIAGIKQSLGDVARIKQLLESR